MKFLFQGESVI